MFNEIGKKIKGVASAVCWIQMVIYAVVGIALMASDDDLILKGFLVICIGCLAAWLGSIVLYGFGELIDKVCSIEKALTDKNNESQSSEKSGYKTPVKSIDYDEHMPHRFLGKCELCGAENIMVSEVKIVDEMGIRYRNACSDCFKKHNCQKG